MERVDDYHKLETLEKIEGREVLVLYSGVIHRVVSGEWIVIGKTGKRKDSFLPTP